MRDIAAIPSAALLAGAAVGLSFPGLPRAAALTCLVCGGVVAAWAWRRMRARLLVAAVVGVFVVGGVLLAGDAWNRAWRPPLRVAFETRARAERAQAARDGRRRPEDDEAFATITGTLRADAVQTESGVSLSVEVEGIDGREGLEGLEGLEGQEGQEGREGHDHPSRSFRPVTGGVVVTVVGSLAAERITAWRAGRRVRLPVQLRRPSRYLDPGVPDHERALARQGTTLVGSVKSGGLVEVLAPGSLAAEAMSAARAFSRRAVHDAVGRWSPRSEAIVAAIVIGDRAGLDAAVQRRLQEAGTYHVIAISGGNIAILAGVLLGAFRFAGWLGRAAMLAAMAALVLYADFVGGGASVDRATLMAVAYFTGRALDHRGAATNSLALVCALLVARDPLAIVDPAFVLTCGATLAILVVAPAVVIAIDVGRARRALDKAVEPRAATAPDAFERRAPRVASRAATMVAAAASMFAASLAAEALLFPVGALVFSRVTFAGLGLNFVAIPLMGVAQIAGMAVVPLAAVSWRLATVAGWVAHLGAAGLVASANLVRFAPILTYRVAPPSPFAIALYYAAGLTAWSLWRYGNAAGSAGSSRVRSGRVLATGVAMAAAGWILIDPGAFVARRGDGRLHAAAIDVGQGDAILVRFPRGSTLLVDAGGLSFGSSFDIGDRVVGPVVRGAGVSRLDYVALTHGDPDHIGGAGSVLREFRPREVWEGIPVPRSGALTRLRMDAQAAGARWANVYDGSRAAVDGVDVVARHPRRAEWERQKVRNDDSLVLELRWRDVSIVLTGDVGKAVERSLASTLEPARLRVVKVPHHGSLTSSSAEFIAALQPRVAIVSAGRSNHFGHPAPEVLERYRSAGAEVFRTDQDGEVIVDTDGYTLDVHTFSGRRARIR